MSKNEDFSQLAPQQARSQKTMQNIMASTIELLNQKAFTEISIQEIVERVGCSVGAFYGRFKDKDSLLHALDDQLTQMVLNLIHELTENSEAAYTTLPDFTTAITQMLYNLYVEQQGMMRTLIITGRTHTDPRFREREDRINAALHPVFLKFLSFRECIKHPNPELAIRFGLQKTHFALREMVLWAHPQGSIPVSGDELIREFVTGFLNYLEYQPPIINKKDV